MLLSTGLHLLPTAGRFGSDVQPAGNIGRPPSQRQGDPGHPQQDLVQRDAPSTELAKETTEVRQN